MYDVCLGRRGYGSRGSGNRGAIYISSERNTISKALKHVYTNVRIDFLPIATIIDDGLDFDSSWLVAERAF